MGYYAHYFEFIVDKWLSEGWLSPGERLIEFGAQEFHSEPEVARAATRSFLLRRGKTEAEVGAIIGTTGPFPVSNVYRALGIDYMAIDVDGSHGSQYFDLSTSRAPDHWKGQFDFVNNGGTIEHLVNPINGFHVAHELLKPGGVVRHSIPMFGWSDHGFLYATPKFFAHLVGDNQYQVLEKRLIRSGTTPLRDPLFSEVVEADMSSLKNLDELKPVENPVVEDYWAILVYRKTHDAPFVAPFDHIISDEAAGIRQRLSLSYAEYANRRLSPGKTSTATARKPFWSWRK
jgi:SAM-dependent methyltransferase